MNSIKLCEYSWSRSFHDDLILQDQASGERSQDQWSSGYYLVYGFSKKNWVGVKKKKLFFLAHLSRRLKGELI